MCEVSANEGFYNSAYRKFVQDGGDEGMADAAALAQLVEKCIKEKDYTVYGEHVRDSLEKYDVICTFSLAGDPTFGIYRYDDENTIVSSTKEGLNYKYL